MLTRNLPPDIVLAYKRYKQDTETVAGWLAERAEKAGYTANTDTAAIGKGPKLKGRARKLARDAAKQAPAQPKQKYTYIVKTTEFVPMAKHIAKIIPKITLKRTMKAIWERAIKMRHQCGDWFKDKADNDVLADERHTHFACVLEEALTILKPCYESGVKSKVSPPPKKVEKVESSIEEINNIFAHLEIEETLPEEEQESATIDGHLPDTPKTPRAHIEFNEKEAEGEFFFAIWSFLQDVLALRLHVATNWYLYSRGALELMHVASLTNLAIDLVRRAEGDLEAILQRPSKYPVTKYPTGSLPFLIFKLHLPQNRRSLGFDPDTADTVIICGCPTCDFLLYMPWAMANSYVKMLKEDPPTFPSENNKQRVQVPPMPTARILKSYLFHAQNPSQKAQTELGEILPTFSMLSLMLRRIFIEDEILHAARHILENHTVPIWVSLALQIQLDIQRLTTLHPIKAFEDLKKSFQATKVRCKEHQDWSKSLGFQIWRKSNDEHVGVVASQFGDWIEGGKCGRHDGEDIRHRVDAGEQYDEAFKAAKRLPLLELFPVTCGTMKTEIQLEFHLLGVRLINGSGHVMMLCHLYNALRIISPSAGAWPDMELVIRNQGENKVFIGGRPKTLEDAHKRLCLASGMSLTGFAKDTSRGGHFRQENVEKRAFKHSPLAQNLLDRWLGRETRKIDEAAYDLQQLLFNTEYERRLKEDMYSATATQMDQVVSKLVPASTKMVQTLSRLSQAFNAEMPAIAFDYFSFQRRCFDMFSYLSRDARVTLQIEDHEFGKESSRNEPFSITLYIIRNAASIEDMIRAVTSTNRAHHKAVAKYQAKQMQALSKLATNEESKVFVANAVTMIREGRQDDLLKKFVDLTENAAALEYFGPVQSVIGKTIEEGNGDKEIRKLRKVTDKTTYGVFLFSKDSLDALYGPDSLDQWKDIGVTVETIRKATLCTADNSTLYAKVMIYLHQPKVMCGTGKNSHAASGLKSTNSPCPSDQSDKSDNDEDEAPGPASTAGLARHPMMASFLNTIMGLMIHQARSGAGEPSELGDAFRRLVQTDPPDLNEIFGNDSSLESKEVVDEQPDNVNDGRGVNTEHEDEDDWDRSGIYGRQGRYASH